jgi:hypothetical protein
METSNDTSNNRRVLAALLQLVVVAARERKITPQQLAELEALRRPPTPEEQKHLDGLKRKVMQRIAAERTKRSPKQDVFAEITLDELCQRFIVWRNARKQRLATEGQNIFGKKNRSHRSTRRS